MISETGDDASQHTAGTDPVVMMMNSAMSWILLSATSPLGPGLMAAY